MHLISTHTLRSGGSFSSPDFYLLIPLPVATTHRARRGGPRSAQPLPGVAVPLGSGGLSLGNLPQHPSRPAPGLTRQQTGLTPHRSARGPCPHRQLCSQLLLFPSLRLSCSVTSQRGPPDVCWLLLASFKMMDRPSRLPSPPGALPPTGACPQKEQIHSVLCAPGLVPEPSTGWVCPSEPCSTQPQLTRPPPEAREASGDHRARRAATSLGSSSALEWGLAPCGSVR